MALGIDIGGANLKLADDTGLCRSIAFPMWTEFGQLGFAVRKLIHDFANIPLGRPLAGELGSELAVTMTGELADCFATRREGVRSILEQLCEALPEFQISVYAVGGRWLCPESAIGQPWEVAASNWYALAEWLLHSQVLCGTDNSLLAGPLHRDERLLCSQNFENTMEVDLMIDVGSTTVDIIPIHAGRVATPARTDRGRLQLGQLVYSGMQRTPIAALVQVLAIDDVPCPVMAERFATTDDAYLALGLVAEAPQDHDSADGRPRTVACAGVATGPHGRRRQRDTRSRYHRRYGPANSQCPSWSDCASCGPQSIARIWTPAAIVDQWTWAAAARKTGYRFAEGC